MNSLNAVVILSLGALLSVPGLLRSQETEVREALLRTLSALNTRHLDEFLSYLMPRTQIFSHNGVGLRELDVGDWRARLQTVQEFNLVPREIRILVYGNTAVTAAYIHGTVRSPSGWVEGGPWRYSETRIHEQGNWKVLQMHFSPLVHNVGQVPDRGFDPAIDNPAYAVGTGPLVLIDEAHFNQFTAWHMYWAFAELLRRDGYVVRESGASFSPEALESASVLVIANAMSHNVFDNQQAPPLPAFTAQEVAAVREWVNGGGSLLLMVDHNPYPGSAEAFAQAFGIQFWNCGASYPGSTSGRLMFRRLGGAPADPVARGGDSVSYGSGGRLIDHPVTMGIDSVATFLGSAFRVDAPHYPLLVFGPGVECWSRTDLVLRPQGQSQGALLEFGNGRIVVFGDAGMFAAQFNAWAGTKTGMNNPIAAQNPRLLLNVMHWLTRLGERR